MSHSITIKLPSEVYQPLREMARREGQTIEEFAAEKLAENIPPARRPLDEASRREAEERFARHIGAFNSGDARSADNERIDADLARAYAETHDDE